MNKKSDIKIIIKFVIIGIALFGFIGYKVKNDFFTDDETHKKLLSLDLYGYTLSKSDTDLYKDNFKTLEAILNEKPINYSDYAKQVSKLFIIDVFTLTNKVSSTDIGGLEFLHKKLKENFKENMGATLYKNVEVNLDGNRTQELPEVSKIEATEITETKFTYGEVEYDAYLVTLNWEYKKDLGYAKSMKLTLIKDSDKLYVVKGE